MVTQKPVINWKPHFWAQTKVHFLSLLFLIGAASNYSKIKSHNNNNSGHTLSSHTVPAVGTFISNPDNNPERVVLILS